MIDYYFKLQILRSELENIEQEIKELIAIKNQIFYNIDEIETILFDSRLGS